MTPIEQFMTEQFAQIAATTEGDEQAFSDAMNAFQVNLAHATASFIASATSEPAGLLGTFTLNLTGALSELLAAPDTTH